MSRHLLPLLFAAACSTAFAAEPAPAPTAQDPAAHPLPQRLAAADTNGDGMLDRSETEAGTPRLHARFDRIDSDGDGKLSPSELESAIERAKARQR